MLKNELEAVISSDERWSGISTLILAAGIIGEYVVIKWLEHISVKTLRHLFKRPSPRILTLWSKRTRISLEVVFAALVVLGVVGEWYFAGRIAKNANLLQQNADAELAEAATAASDAIQRAERADARTLREIDARLELQSRLVWEGPRDIQIIGARARFKKYLTEFRTQPINILVCGQQLLVLGDQEITQSEGALSLVLKESGWEVKPFNDASIVRQCGTIGEQIEVLVDSDAPTRTKDAATMFVAVLDTAILQGFPVQELSQSGLKQNGIDIKRNEIGVMVRRHMSRLPGLVVRDLQKLFNERLRKRISRGATQ
jgi:hypothetical protein